jgi:hypothetical protein
MNATAPVEYPSLPPPVHSFRQAEVISIKAFLESEVDKHLLLYKRSKSILNTLKWVRYILINIMVGLNAATLASLLLTLLSSYSLYFEILSIAFGVVINVLSVVETRLERQVEKHDEQHTLAISSLLSVTELLSTALDDNSITDSEFKMVVNERRKYIDMRNAVRHKHFHEADAQEIKKSVSGSSTKGI